MSVHEQIPMKSAATTVAPHFASAPWGTLQRQCSCGGGCSDCKKKKLQRAARDAGGATGFQSVLGHGQDAHGTTGGTAPSVVHDVLRSPGQPLDSSTRAYFEPRFGHDFSRVRVHADSRAAASAAAVNAHAYTLGSNVAFAAGHYSPSTDSGRRLLAHELTHVVQQSGAGGGVPSAIQVGPAGDASEHEAERVAETVMSDVAPTFRSAHRASGNDRDANGADPSAGSGQALKVGATKAATNGATNGTLRRLVVVNPPAAGPSILRQFETICPNSFSLVGGTITQHCGASNAQFPRGCECLCDATHDPKRTYTFDVQPSVLGSEQATLFDKSTATVPTITHDPETQIGTNPTVKLPADGPPVEFGSFTADGSAEPAEDWRILAHEFCGHARTSGGAGDPGNRPLHNLTIDIENIIAGEHGRPARGHFNDRRQGESYIRGPADPGKLKFTLKDGLHFEAP